MPKNTLLINNKDAYTTWGISMDSIALSTLMTPPSMKDYISNSSRLDNGKSVISDIAKLDSREVTLTFYLSAKTENQFFSRYNSFCEELQKGKLVIRSKYQGRVNYNMLYISCTQFSEYNRGLAKFSLKLMEPNPSQRSLVNGDLMFGGGIYHEDNEFEIH